MSVLQQFLKQDVRLPSAPAIAVRILQAVKEDEFSFSQIGSIIQSDPALASRILRLANSQVYALPKKVSTVDMAIALLGVNVLKNMALSFTLVQVFKGHRGERFDFDRLWRRSITAAVAAQLIADTIGRRSDEVFITSLLQEIGIGAMFMVAREEYVAVLDDKVTSGLPVCQVEKQRFGFDHQEFGAELLKSWGLPEQVYMPIRYHHDVGCAPPEYRPLCNILHAADRLSAVYHGSASVKNVRQAHELLKQLFQMTEDDSTLLIDSVAEKSVEVLSQFSVDPGHLKPFSQLMQEANEELSRLSLSYEALVIEHREAKQKAEQLALDLRTANEKLREAALRDSLTGLYNHRYFQEALDRELHRAERHHQPLALVMLDIDNFKAVNDEHGHPVGDIVLRTIAQTLVKDSRRSDVVARYGGEEFIIILPETNLAGALRKAETCRQAAEAIEVKIDSISIRATVSVGVAASDVPRPLSKHKLLAAADRALYRSKREGRNRVTVWDPSIFEEV